MTNTLAAAMLITRSSTIIAMHSYNTFMQSATKREQKCVREGENEFLFTKLMLLYNRNTYVNENNNYGNQSNMADKFCTGKPTTTIHH